MKIAVLGNQARAMNNFWNVLIRRMIALGHEVLCFVPDPLPGDDPGWEKALADTGSRLVHYPLDRKGLNPLRDLGTLLSLRALFKKERPDVLFAFTIKPVIYGAFAAALAGIPARERRHVMITGLGFMFEGGSPAKKCLMQLARLLYRAAFACAGTVFFQNEDDRNLFGKLSITTRDTRVRMCRGTGVDTAHFALQAPVLSPPVFLFVGRLLEAKGLRELYAAAAQVKARYPEALFRILGPEERGVGAVPLAEVLGWQKQGILEYLGETRNVRPYLAQASVIVLPSWREGTPCSLMEGMSTGRAVIAADAPGSREVVRDGDNGFLVPVRDAAALARAMERFILEPERIASMGIAGRALAEKEFDAERVAAGILRDMNLEKEPTP